MIKINPMMLKMSSFPGEKLTRLPQVKGLSPELRRDIRVVSRVLPFKVNNYLVEQLIDWSNIPDDPIYRLTFPHRDMLLQEDYNAVADLLDRGAPGEEIDGVVHDIRLALNPNPGDQLQKNVPVMGGDRIDGLQHKYRETVLYFPAQGQTCHAYCGYCVRWSQFVGNGDLKQMSRDVEKLTSYLRKHREVTDVLITGGDPMVMSARNLQNLLEPLLAEDLDHVQTLRLGTKALAYWPFRFTTDRDADDLLRLLERCVRRGKHLAFMAHFTHPRELHTRAVVEAVRRLRDAGAVIRTQSPLVCKVNDDAKVWADMWRHQVRLDMIPYYMFVQRDTGARRYYEIPLARAHAIYRGALKAVSGLSRTVRGPSMSASPGKVLVDGISEVAGERVFNLRFLQARNPRWVGIPFYARFDEEALWFDDLRPAFGERRFFFEKDLIQDWRDLELVRAHGGNGKSNGNGRRNGRRPL